MIIHFPTIHDGHGVDILHNRNIVWLSSILTSIKSRMKNLKVGDGVKLVTRENHSIMSGAKGLEQFAQCFLLHRQILIHPTPAVTQLAPHDAIARVCKCLCGLWPAASLPKQFEKREEEKSI